MTRRNLSSVLIILFFLKFLGTTLYLVATKSNRSNLNVCIFTRCCATHQEITVELLLRQACLFYSIFQCDETQAAADNHFYGLLHFCILL